MHKEIQCTRLRARTRRYGKRNSYRNVTHRSESARVEYREGADWEGGTSPEQRVLFHSPGERLSLIEGCPLPTSDPLPQRNVFFYQFWVRLASAQPTSNTHLTARRVPHSHGKHTTTGCVSARVCVCACVCVCVRARARSEGWTTSIAPYRVRRHRVN